MHSDTDTAWAQLMNAPWGQFSVEAKAAKAQALLNHQHAWERWRDKRVADGRWAVTRPPTWAEV